MVQRPPLVRNDRVIHFSCDYWREHCDIRRFWGHRSPNLLIVGGKKMMNQPSVFVVQQVREETKQMHLISLNGDNVWSFVPGQVAVLGIEEVGESYFAIASAPEDRQGMDFLIRDGKGVSGILFMLNRGDQVQGKGPVGKGFPIDQFRGRDLLLAAVGSAIAPMRSVLRSILYRRADFAKVVLVYGVRHHDDFPFLEEMEEWRQANIQVTLTVSRPKGLDWKGRTGYVQSHFEEALGTLHQPVALVCGMKEMMDQSRDQLTSLGVAATEVLTNY